MNSPAPPDETEWALQERARKEERSSAAAAPGTGLNRYRLIARVLQEPLAETLPQDFAAMLSASTGRHSAALPRQRAILITAGIVYLAAMSVAAFLTRTDIRHAVAMFDGPIGLLAILAAASLATPRIVAFVRLVRFLPAAG